MTETKDRKASDVRIYCDNDESGDGKRWQLVPDVTSIPDAQKNSKKPFDEQQWWDHINQIFQVKGAKGMQDVDDKGDKSGLAQTYRKRPDPDTADGENKERESITVCEPSVFKMLYF